MDSFAHSYSLVVWHLSSLSVILRVCSSYVPGFIDCFSFWIAVVKAASRFSQLRMYSYSPSKSTSTLIKLLNKYKPRGKLLQSVLKHGKCNRRNIRAYNRAMTGINPLASLSRGLVKHGESVLGKTTLGLETSHLVDIRHQGILSPYGGSFRLSQYMGSRFCI